MKFTTFVYHVQEGHVREDLRIKGERVFRKETLDAFKAKHLNDVGLTKEQIAEKYGQEVPVVRGHLRRKQIKPFAKQGKSHVYKSQDIDGLANQLGWHEQLVEREIDAVGA